MKMFRGTWKNACKYAGVPELLFHDLRRTGARNLRRAGVAEGVIMKIGGWRTRSVFERYAIVSRNDIADAILKLQESEKRAEQERALAEDGQRRKSQHSGGKTPLQEPSTKRNSGLLTIRRRYVIQCCTAM